MRLTDRYPGKLAWQLSAPKRIVRKSQPFKVFQRFLVGETEVVSSQLTGTDFRNGKDASMSS